MFRVIPWSDHLDLSSFYKEAERRGFKNNSSKKMLVDSLSTEKNWAVWILYYDRSPIGSVAAHSFEDVMGNNSYRIAARTCIFTDQIKGNYGSALRTKSVITQNQNPTAQFLIPTCIDWAPEGSKLYITTNASDIGTQKKVHNTFGPLMEKQGMMKRICNVFYREHHQTVWELYPKKFYEILNKYPRWK